MQDPFIFQYTGSLENGTPDFLHQRGPVGADATDGQLRNHMLENSLAGTQCAFVFVNTHLETYFL